MTRTPWNRLASSSISTALRRLVTRVGRRPGAFDRRPRRRAASPLDFHPVACVAAEVLEERRLLFATAAPDTFSVVHDRTLTVSAASGVLANDQSYTGGHLTAILVTGTSHGTLTLNGDGSLQYVTNVHYIGSDTFTYKDQD